MPVSRCHVARHRRKKSKPKRRSIPLMVEVLETRWLPSAYMMTVNTTADTVNSVDNKLSLLEAVEIANNTLSPASLSAAELGQLTTIAGTTDIIQFSATLAGATLTATAADVGDNPGAAFGPSAFTIKNATSVIIDGRQAPGLVVAFGGGATNFRAFTVMSGGNLTLENLEVSGFTAQGAAGAGGSLGGSGGAGMGGALFSAGNLAVEGVTFTDNRALGGAGGAGSGIGNAGGAGGAGLGGVVFNDGGTLTLVNSTFFSNTAQGGTGGAGSAPGGSGQGTGGAVFVDGGMANLANDTFSNNAADQAGAVFLAATATAVLDNSILANTPGGATDLDADATAVNLTGTGNIVGNTSFTSNTTFTFATMADPGVAGSLADNGGPTRTLALSATSAAIDAGDVSVVSSATFSAFYGPSPTDQRGLSRLDNGMIDVGAFEHDATLSGTFVGATATFNSLLTANPIATFTDPDNSAVASDFSATIDWGDGTPTSADISTGVVSGSTLTGFSVAGTHTYAVGGAETATVVITEVGGGKLTLTGAITIADPVALTGGFEFDATVGTQVGPETVATFTDPAGAGPIGDYSATIDWGDGSPASAGTISFNTASDLFTVQGAHTYTAAGSYTMTVVVDHDGALASVTDTDPASMPQTINFVTIPNHTYGDPSFTISATASSGLQVAFTVDGTSTGSVTITGTTLTAGVTTATVSITGAGSVIIDANQAGDGTYLAALQVQQTFTVSKAALTITADDEVKTYGSTFTFNGTQFMTSGLVYSDTVTAVMLTSTGAAATAQVSGSPYTIMASGAVGTGLSNYTITYDTGNLTVNTKALTITATDQSKNYGDTVTFNGSTQFTTSGLVNGDTVTSVTLNSTGAVSTATVAGSPYGIVASAAVGVGLTNYTITYDNGNLTVNRIALTITASDQTKTYGGTFTFAGTEFTSNGLINGDTVTSVTLNSTGAAATATVAGSPYTITASAAMGSGLGNYTITYDTGHMTVTTASLTITANNASKTYGQSVTFSGNEFTTSTLFNGDTVTSVTLASTGTATTATVGGSPYAIVASNAVGTGLSNYTITYDTGNLTVNQKALTITANNASKTYGQSIILSGGAFTSSGLINGDTVTDVTLNSAGAAGTAQVSGSPYAIVASAATGTGLGNYNIGYVNGNLTVNQKALTITANSTSKTYGQTVTFLGTEFSTGGGLINGDTITSVTLTSAGAAATALVSGSPYAIVASAAIGSGVGNYSITYANGSLTVNQTALTITADDQTKTYGTTFTFTGNEFTTSGLVNGDTVSSVTLTSAGAAASATISPPGPTYAIVASAAVGAKLGNYAITYVAGTMTVGQQTLTITANSTTKTYGQVVTFAGTEFTTTGLANGDSVTSVTLTSAGAAVTATVTTLPYSIVISNAQGAGLSNYNIVYINGTLTVNTTALTITADSASKNYGDLVTFAGTEFATGSGQLINGDTVTSVTLTSAGAAVTATVAGSPYSIIASAAVGSGLGNYAITYANGSLSVSPIALTITANNLSKTYGQALTFAGTEFSALGLINGDTVNSVTLTSPGAAATALVSGSPYAITASNAVGTGVSNYTINYVGGTLTVGQQTLTITAKNIPKTYGLTLTFAGTEFTASGLANGDSVSSVTLASSGAVGTAAVGSYAIVVSGAMGSGLSNYTVNYVNGTLTVNQKALTVTANDQMKTYGNTFTFAGTEFVTSGLVNGDTVVHVILTSTGAAATAAVGTDPIVASSAAGTGLTNYAITYVNGTLTINKLGLMITADDQSKTYGATFTFAGTEFMTAGLVNGDTVTRVTFTSLGAGATAQVSGSPYAITASAAVGTGLSNYTITYVNGMLTVNPKALTITAKNQSKIYGDTFTFAGTEFTTSGLVNSDAVTSVTLTSAGAAATALVSGSPYAITASAAVGTGLGNYTISYVDGSLTVNLRSLTIIANDQSKTYGDTFTFAGTEFGTVTGSEVGLVNGDTVTSVTLTSAGAVNTATVAGSPYVITASNAQGTGLDNYSIRYVTGSLTVNQAPLTITADDQSKVYADPLPTLTITYSGFVNGESTSNLTTQPGITTTAQSTSPIGTYTITVTGAVDTNYAIRYEVNYGLPPDEEGTVTDPRTGTGTLTITPAVLTITADDKIMPLGGSLPSLTVHITGFVNGDTTRIVTTQPTLSTVPANSQVGTYPITVSGAEITSPVNYNIVYVNGTLSILVPSAIPAPPAPPPSASTLTADSLLVSELSKQGAQLTATSRSTIVSEQVQAAAIRPQPAGSADFSYRGTGEIIGRVFEDENASGKIDQQAGGIEGQKVYLDLNGNGEYDEGEPVAYTDARGQYHFTGLPPGQYTVRLLLQRSQHQTFPEKLERTVELQQGAMSATDITFGIWQRRRARPRPSSQLPPSADQPKVPLNGPAPREVRFPTTAEEQAAPTEHNGNTNGGAGGLAVPVSVAPGADSDGAELNPETANWWRWMAAAACVGPLLRWRSKRVAREPDESDAG